MSTKSYDSHSSDFRRSSESCSDDEAKSKKANQERKERMERERARMNEEREREQRKTENLFNESLVRSKITKPAKGVKRVHVVLVDNSGSNRAIADHLMKSSGYLMAALNVLDPESQIAFVYFSDHGDGNLFQQYVDFTTPNETGDKIMYSTVQKVKPAHGYDEAEAIECVLYDICETDFGEATEKHLYLVSDVVAHGMGMSSDDGCPYQRDWKQSLKKVQENFTSFEVVGCGDDIRIGELQKQFLKTDRVAFDFIDLSAIRQHRHRMGIVGNGILFLIARRRGIQAVEMFLFSLYEKWISDPVFGGDTDINAREAIVRFMKYLEISEEKKKQMLEKIIV